MKILHYISIFILLAACSQNTENAEIEAPETNSDEILISESQFASGEMQLGKISQHNFADYITVNGMIQAPPNNLAEVSTYYGGYVKNINLLPGTWVNAGQRLFTLENPDLIQAQQDYLEAKSQLDYLRKDYERQRILVKEQIVSQKKYQRAKADYDLVKTQVDVLGKKLRMMQINPQKVTGKNLHASMSITAPISGYVDNIKISKGQYLSPQDVALTITNTQNMHLELKVFEKDLSKIQKDMPVDFYLSDSPDKIYQATVHIIGQQINPESKTVDVHCDFDVAQGNFASGMFANAKILTNENLKYALPKTAVLDLDGVEWILTATKQKDRKGYLFTKEIVETGMADDAFIEIKNYRNVLNKNVVIEGGFQIVQ